MQFLLLSHLLARLKRGNIVELSIFIYTMKQVTEAEAFSFGYSRMAIAIAYIKIRVQKVNVIFL
ncbi:hypothetical protein EF384_01475 [Aerococcus agrisoli]|uniref:Uncharacterized protein n=1 Tax=Aerococcus agrisoli TaxID=2487350 RepID=A0A3N4GQ63_9LACT|nr:hypothetical protein EF384_01475 [Aerococcus agrisoli]